MKAPLDASDFEGSFSDAGSAGASLVGQARFDGYFATTLWPREEAAACLPAGLRLAEPTNGHRAHPVVFAFGTQSETAVLLGPARWPTGFRYLELAIIIPFVRLHDGPRLYLHLPRMYAGDRWATWTGNQYYGYNKVNASVRWLGGTLAVTDPRHGLVIEAKVASEGEWTRAAKSMDGMMAVKELTKLPVLGVRDDGAIVSSYFNWDLSPASLRPALASVSLQPNVAPGSRAGEHHGIDGATFEVRGMRWSVSWPRRCSS